jgi:hypothetical protein
MQLVAQGSQGSFNGAAEVTLVPAPSSGSRMVRSLYIHNGSGGSLTITVAKKSGATNYTISSHLVDDLDTIMFGDGDILCLTSGESIVGYLYASPAVNPSFVSNWGDK